MDSDFMPLVVVETHPIWFDCHIQFTVSQIHSEDNAAIFHSQIQIVVTFACNSNIVKLTIMSVSDILTHTETNVTFCLVHGYDEQKLNCYSIISKTKQSDVDKVFGSKK